MLQMKLFFLLFSILIAGSVADIDLADVYWLEHAIDTSDFTEIGSLNLKQIKQSQNAAQFQSYNADSDQLSSDRVQFSTQLESNEFDQQVKDEIENAYKANNNSVYRLRLVRKQPYSVVTSSFTYLKYLIESNFNINLTLTTGYTGRLNSMSIKTQPTRMNQNSFNYLTVHASVQNIKPGQVPETEVYLEKLRKEQEQKEKGAQGENQSFLSKYWIYIVPFVVIMFLSGLANPEGGAAAGGGGGR